MPVPDICMALAKILLFLLAGKYNNLSQRGTSPFFYVSTTLLKINYIPINKKYLKIITGLPVTMNLMGGRYDGGVPDYRGSRVWHQALCQTYNMQYS